MRLVLLGCLVLGLTPSVLQAQEISDEEILNKLLGQLEETEERTRGLGIVTGKNADPNATTDQNDDYSSLEDIKAGTAATVVPDPNDKTRVSENLEINIQIQFEFDSAALASSEQPALDQMCRVMKKAEDVKLFQIVGHTDSSGSEAYNARLSQLRADEVTRLFLPRLTAGRADEVTRYLTNDCGIEATRLRAVGYGEEFPNNANDPRAPENRRVELQVLG